MAFIFRIEELARQETSVKAGGNLQHRLIFDGLGSVLYPRRSIFFHFPHN
jgi:hypothetical protein